MTGSEYAEASKEYPIVSEVSAEQLVLCLDEHCPALNQAGEGEPLFDDEGIASPFVLNMIQFMQDYQADFQRTQRFVEHLQQLDLLKESTAKITLNSK